MSARSEPDPVFDHAVLKPKAGCGVGIVEGFVSLGVALLIALFLPANRSPDGSDAKRLLCVGNLKQIGQALHNYEQEHGAFRPPIPWTRTGGRCTVGGR